MPRPNDDGYAQDVEFALKVENMTAEQRRAAQTKAMLAKRQAEAPRRGLFESDIQSGCGFGGTVPAC